MDHPVNRAADVAGSKAALARALRVTRAAVSQWLMPGRAVPAEHCPVIERLTDGAVRCEDLRPDVEWWVLRQRSAEAKERQKVPVRPAAQDS